MKSGMQLASKIVFGTILVTAFSGCGNIFKKASKDSSEALIVINGESVLTKGEFNKYLDQFLQMPQFRGVMTVDNMPEALKKQILQGLLNQKVILYWAKKNNVEKDAEFKKKFDEVVELIKEQSIIKHFEQNTFDNIKIDDAELKSEFDKNAKSFVKSQGGVATLGVRFEKPEAATAFMTKIKGNEANFEKLAQGEKGFADFGRIDKDAMASGKPKAIVDSVLAATVFPMVKVIKDGAMTWVVCATNRKETEYQSFEEAKETILQGMRRQKIEAEATKRLEDLKKEYKPEIREDVLFKKADLKVENDTKTCGCCDACKCGSKEECKCDVKGEVKKPAETNIQPEQSTSDSEDKNA